MTSCVVETGMPALSALLGTPRCPDQQIFPTLMEGLEGS